jgi:hypothetical protein
MGKRNIETSKEEQHSFPKFKSYSVDEILAAGGPTAFAEKMGKSWESLIDRLEKLPKDAFLTDEEFDEAMKTLNQSK